MTKATIFLASVLLSTFLTTATARAANLKLLTPKTGWALAGPGLMWTTDGGADWTNITPPLPAGEHVSAVFFLNTQDGWVLLTGATPGSKAPHLDIATTVNSGASWSVAPLDVPGTDLAADDLSGGGHLFFLDTLNGWANLDIPGMSRPALLLETHDGGGNWSRSPNNPNVAGELRFINSKIGWLLGGPSGAELYATRNGGERWTQISLTATVGGGPTTCGLNGLPHFKDENHGYVATSCLGGAIVLFGTEDGGKTWKQQRVLTGMAGMATVATSVADSALIAGAVSDQTLTLLRETPQGMTKASSKIAMPRSGVSDLSFADTMNGWALLEYHGTAHQLLATSDGGNSWTDITPHTPLKPPPPFTPSGQRPTSPRTGEPYGDSGPARPQGFASDPAPATQPLSSPNESSLALTLEAPNAGGKASFHTSIHTGFDSCFDRTKVTQQQFLSDMQAWWTYSPYYDYGLYLGGVNTKCLLPTGSSTVSSLASQGWGIMPLWVGLQAPCTTGFYTFSDDPTTAAADGKAEADSATGTIATASSLGLSKAVIYYDLEQYNTTNDPNCGPSVTAFIGAWVNEMQKNGYSAGVYVNMYGARDQVSEASPPPNEAWVPKWDNRATIWGLGVLNDTLWSTDQRAHQFVAPHNETWGSVTIDVDSDIEDAPVAGSNGTKTLSWTLAEFQYPGAGGTSVMAINDLGGVGAFDYTGQTAGNYCVPSICSGFIDIGGSFTSFSYPGSTSTEFTGLNNVGQAVGNYEGSSGFQGFVYAVGQGTFTNAPLPSGAIEGYPYAINDDGQMVGCYVVGSAPCNGYLDNGGSFTTIDYPNANGTSATGINGAGEIVGYYSDSMGNGHAFIDHNGSFTSFDCKGASVTEALGINNNGIVVGVCWSTPPQHVGFVYDSAHNTFISDSLTYQGQPTYLWGINDNAEMGGNFLPSGQTGVQGLTATH